MRIYILSFLFIFAFTCANAQEPTKAASADFKNAIEITDSIAGPFNVSLGYGKEMEFKFDAKIKEDNSIWFKFVINHDTLLTFDIVPKDSLDDYDFILFKCADANCISNIRSRKVVPDRVCFSYNSSKSSTTGLSEYTTMKMIGTGDGSAYVAGLPVKTGEVYYLMVNNAYDGIHYFRNKFPKGFMLYFYNYWPKKKAIVLKNVLFENNSAILLKSSFPELDKLTKMLTENLLINIEIRGYTDNVGDIKSNQKLSELRAKAVVDYLVAKGIKRNRLYFKGLGDAQPIVPNETAAGRSQNRRVEFSIIMK